jgi:tripartite-type tricarboxylate transporter receptor subunit TctC
MTHLELPRRQFLHLAAGVAALPAVSRIARAQTYPTRPVHVIVGFPPGSSPDVAARLIGQWLSERLGQQFVIENKIGANGNLAGEAVARGSPDGYSLLVIGAPDAINVTFQDKLSFNLLRDIVPVAGFMRLPNVIVVHPSVPVKTIPEFIAYAKANPGKINIGTPTIGTPQYVTGELFKMLTGINIAIIPYRGGPQAVSDLLGGQIHGAIGTALLLIEQIRAGALRPIAVTSATRLELLPDISTVGESIPGFESDNWIGVGAPRNTPAEIVERLNVQINAALADPKVKTRIAELGGAALSGSSAQFATLVADETEKWGKVIRAANIKPE